MPLMIYCTAALTSFSDCITFLLSEWRICFNPIRPGGGGKRAGRGPNAKNQGYHQLIELKFCMSHYSHKSMPDAKFESGSLFCLVDMTSQNFPLRKGTSHQVQIFTPGKWI